MRKLLLRTRLRFWAACNWMDGLAFSPVERCRTCDHTVYETDRIGRHLCRYCA